MTADEVEPEVHDFPLRVGDVLMMCSDGLTEMIVGHADRQRHICLRA